MPAGRRAPGPSDDPVPYRQARTDCGAGYGWWRNPYSGSPVDWFIRIRSRHARLGIGRTSTWSSTLSLPGWFGS